MASSKIKALYETITIQGTTSLTGALYVGDTSKLLSANAGQVNQNATICLKRSDGYIKIVSAIDMEPIQQAAVTVQCTFLK